MEERLPAAGGTHDDIDRAAPFEVLKREWRKIVLLSLAAGVVTLLVMLAMPNIYQATAVIAPPPQEKKEIPALGKLASFGVSLGEATKVEDLESLFRSNDLTVRVFGRHDIWPILYKDRYDPKTGKLKRSWISRLFGGKGPEPSGEWDAIREARSRLRVLVNRRAGNLSISFESPSAVGSAEIVRHYLDEGKNRLQEEALDRAVRNKKFIEEQIGKTVDALTRDRLYALLGQEVEQEMMARNREQFGFRVIDSPRIPDRKLKPRRVQGTALVFLLSFFTGCVFVVVRGNHVAIRIQSPVKDKG
jgi:uncharacterized protein involved in exopolysaccharide biosynthesis